MPQLRILPVLSTALLLLTACEKADVNDPQSALDAPLPDNTLPDNTLISGVRMDYLDTSVDPADDFYRYANGNWLNNTDIPSDKSRYGAFIILSDRARDEVRDIVQAAADNPDAGQEAQQIGDFYRSFMDTETINETGLAPLQPYFEQIDAIADFSGLSAYFGNVYRAGISSLAGFYIDTDEKQPDAYITYFGQSGLGLPDRDYYLKDDDTSQQVQAAYRAHIATMFELADLPDGENAAGTLYAMESAIAAKHWPRADLRDREKTYNKVSLEQLTSLSGKLDWPAYLAATGIDTGKTGHFVISAPSYFESFDELLGAYSLDDWKLYAQWRTLSGFANLLNEEIDQEDFNFYGTVLSGTEEQETRWKRAINLENRLLGDAIGKLYVEQHFPPEAKQRMVALVENLRAAYREAILELDWMGEETKQKAIEKLEKFTPKIGYPDEWKDLSALQISADDLFGNTVQARRFHHQYEVNKLGQPVNRSEWFMNPQTVNAYYNPGMNEIVFPAAILRPPFFNMEADDAINYGAIGGVIGHEMGHGFDDQGAKSDGDGLLQNWWTEQDLEEFKSRTGKLVEQYNGFTVLDDLHINGQLTLGENIGDLGGLTIAHRAYQLSLNGEPAREIDGFSGEERFFLGWGQVWANMYRDEELRRRILTDPHSPPRFRANGVLRNMPEFYATYGVEEGDGMYLPPAQRVKIW